MGKRATGDEVMAKSDLDELRKIAAELQARIEALEEQDDDDPMLFCNACQAEHPASAFNRDANYAPGNGREPRADGRRTTCREYDLLQDAVLRSRKRLAEFEEAHIDIIDEYTDLTNRAEEAAIAKTAFIADRRGNASEVA
jgi:hypothetical protein